MRWVCFGKVRASMVVWCAFACGINGSTQN